MIQNNQNPQVSVVVPVYNDPDGIEATLDSLTNQTCRDEAYEIIVVDNDSTDETPSVIESFASAHQRIVPKRQTEIQSSYAARNRGIECASGTVIAFIDADMWVEEDWIESISRTAGREGYDYFGCNVEIKPVNQPPTLAERYNIATGFPVEKYVQQSNFAPTCCLVTRASVFEEVGTFDERLISSGDKEFGKRVHENDISQQFVPEITMYHPARKSLSDLCNKAFRIGRGRAQLRNFHDDSSFEKVSLLDPKHVLPPIPHRFYRNFSVEDFSRYELAILYMYSYLIILYSAFGQFYETVSINIDR